MGDNRYIEWLRKQGTRLYEAENIFWIEYNRALIPAPATPCFVHLNHDKAKALLRNSGALLIRYASDPSSHETEWWNVVCDKYDIQKLSSNTRSKINRSKKMCSVKNIDAEWIAFNGYECYLNAYNRYANMTPHSKEEFQDVIIKTVGGPFEYWGVFVGDQLAGYCQCIIEGNVVATNVFKYDPSYLKHYTSYALIDNLLTHFVFEQGKRMSNGARSIAHDTNTQDFLLKFNFQRQYCHLNIVYQPLLSLAVQTLYPFRKLIDFLPDKANINKVRSLLLQEKLHRSFGH